MVRTFEDVFKKYYRSLVLYAGSLIGDKALAEDIVQGIFVKLWNNRLFHSIGSHQAYLYSATRNACIDYKRSKRRYFSFSETGAEYAVAGNQDEQTDDDERIAQLYKIIDDFPPKCKAVFFQVCIKEKSYAESALLMGISTSMVKKQMLKAYRIIREKYSIQ